MKLNRSLGCFVLGVLALTLLTSAATAYEYDWNYGPGRPSSASGGYDYVETHTIESSSSSTIKLDDYYKKTSSSTKETSTIKKDIEPEKKIYNIEYNYYTKPYKDTEVIYVYPSKSKYGNSFTPDRTKSYFQYDDNDYPNSVNNYYVCKDTSGRCYYYDYDYYGYPYSNWRYKQAYDPAKYPNENEYGYHYYYEPRYDWHRQIYNWDY